MEHLVPGTTVSARRRSSTCSTASRPSSTRSASVEEIGAAITAELRTIIDYHNCRVYVLQPDGRTLLPVAFRGELLLRVRGGDPRGAHHGRWARASRARVAATRESLLTPDAREVDFAVADPGHRRHPRVDAGRARWCAATDVTGVIVLSSLGLREVRRGGPAAARGARLARGGRDREREALPGRARGRARPRRRCCGSPRR